MLYVRDLADYLRNYGVNCTIDQYYKDSPPPSWQQWMEQQIEESQFVLMVCSPSYSHLISRKKAATMAQRGLGSQFEGLIMYGCLSKDPSVARRKFIPVFFGRRVTEQIPTVVADSTSYEILFPLDMTMPEQKDLMRLCKRLLGQDRGAEMPSLQANSLPTMDNRYHDTYASDGIAWQRGPSCKKAKESGYTQT